MRPFLSLSSHRYPHSSLSEPAQHPGHALRRPAVTPISKLESVSAMTGNVLAYFHEQLHQPEDRSAIRFRLTLL
jgi:hypothetical protein